MTRAKKQPLLYEGKLDVPKEYFRFSTPKEVAEYRAQRLKCGVLCEVGAGIGGQTIAFSKECKKIIAVEKDEKNFSFLTKNLDKLKIKNVELIHGNALSDDVFAKIKKQKPEIVFCDTERKPQGKRNVKDLSPDIFQFVKKYENITGKIAIEVPPFTSDLDLIDEDFEREFISLNGKLNRLTLYFNRLKNVDNSAIALPSRERVGGKAGDVVPKTKSAKNFIYLYLINPALVLAKLENKFLSSKREIVLMDNKKCLFSDEILNSSFLEGYRILEISENKFERILHSLKRLKAGKVVLRNSIDPKDYWKERRKYEDNLNNGEREIHIFANNKESILCEKI